VDFSVLTPAHRRAIAAVLLLVALVAVGLPRLRSGGSKATDVPPLRPARSAESPSGAARLVVDVAGAVRRPGLYRLAPRTRIADAVAAAGGATRKADLAALNLAAPLADGEQVLVPGRGAPAPGTGAPSATAPLDLNTATVEQLDALPGIGPTTAQKIIDYRQAHGSFHSVQDLDAVPGIGAGRIAQLKGLVLP
jgi:competence protein ComEA